MVWRLTPGIFFVRLAALIAFSIAAIGTGTPFTSFFEFLSNADSKQ
jgi:hypothetical protein